MSGRAYTLREMKTIVEYLTDNNLYSETRGRKMWMDFANSNKTERTWQSLKETFLKRILPDIINPYYRLEPDQIMSFKRGINLTQKDRKLELQPVNNSKTDGANDINDQPSTSKKNTEENATGEDTQCSKIVHNRASTETLILDTCYQTAEDMQSDLESANEEQIEDKAKGKSKPALKSVRDFIEYTEPLTPMLQEVLDDFATDEDCSDAEPPMQIDENYVAQDEISDTPEKTYASQSILKPNKTHNTAIPTTAGEKENTKVVGDVKQVTDNNNDKPSDIPNNTAFSQLEDVMVLVDEALAKNLDKELNINNIASPDKQANSNESIPMTDSLLPNNQEAINDSSKVEVPSPVLPTPNGKGDQENRKKEGEDMSSSKTNFITDIDSEVKASKVSILTNSNEDDNKNSQDKPITNNQKLPENPSLNDDVHEIHSDRSSGNKNENSQAGVDNPCLKSVSLYSEKLTTKYSDSDTNNREKSSQESKTRSNQNNAETKKDADQNKDGSKETENQNKRNTSTKTGESVILLNSRTTSEELEDSDEIHHRPLARSSLKIQKDKKLASVFGFSNGGAPKSRRLNGRKRTTSHRKIQSDSSEWTSTSDSEYVSPPHGRRNRYARKYLKPRAARIMSLEEEGGLFVMLGKKVYPLVKDGKMVKNYVTFLPESDPEEDDSYWKSKYIEERKRTDELKKKLGHSKLNGADKGEKESSVSISSVTSPLTENRPRLPSRQESVQGTDVLQRYSGVMETPANKETLKIKFTKNDQEVQLEGHWQHINPVLAQVVSILHRDSKDKKADAVTCVELSSGNTTPIITPRVTPTVPPVDTGVHNKVDELESAIFKEIEEKDKKEEDVQEPAVEQKGNQENNVPANNAETAQENVAEHVTQRRKRGRPKAIPSSATSAAQSPARKLRKSVQPSKKVEEVKALEVNDTTPVGRTTRSPRKLLNGITPKAKTARKPTAKVQPEAPVEVTETPAVEEPDDDEVRYKFPSPAPAEPTKATNINKNSPKKHLPNNASPDSLSHHSTNSSQGYQDSDVSPFHINLRRKRRLSVSTLSLRANKMKRKQRSRSYPLLKHIDSDGESSNILVFKTAGKEQSSVNSEVYRSESYQFLMQQSRTRERLEKIEEANDNENDTLANEIRNLRDEILKANDSINKTDPASSSILSLPLSPELSIVENLSVSKSDIPEINDHPTINETENNAIPKTCPSKYLMSEVDVSMPLMAQDCELTDKYRKHIMAAMSNLSDAPNSAGRNLSIDSSIRMSITSESILRSYPSINVESSDSLDRRLEQLLLDSAQKPTKDGKMEVDTTVKKKGSRKEQLLLDSAQKPTKDGKMEVDTTVKKKGSRKEQLLLDSAQKPTKDGKMEVDTTVKKKGSRKRCSTPNKKTVQKKKKINQEPVIIEEESKTHCLRGSRRSCPASVNIVYCEENPPENLEIHIDDDNINVTTVTKRKRAKKDVIKVKIVKPKEKVERKKRSPKKKLQNVSRSSNAENESGVFLQGFEDSSELIHNHSETCLQVKECMEDDSDVEYIETTTKSIISLNSSSLASENKENHSRNSIESAELYCDNAQCATNLCDAKTTEVLRIGSAESGTTMYFTTFASRCNSILTEDLSDPPTQKTSFRTSKWYLLSEEESNSNYLDVQEEAPIYGANLQQIFPITCAIPDLSTITEMSEKNDNSQKASLDADDLRRDTK